MAITLIDLSDDQMGDIEARLEAFDRQHITYQLSGSVGVGMVQDGRLVAGAAGCMTAFKIFYLSTLFVEEACRHRGLGKQLMAHVEHKAAALGANMIRLDTFDWQGAQFYRRLGYEQVGYYESADDGFSEHFFLKRL